MLGLLAVAAGPGLLVWQYLRPEPWNPRVRFEGARYEAGGFVFTYLVENRTRRTIRMLPDRTEIHAIQTKGSRETGHISVMLPLEVEAHSAQRVEVRMELPPEPLNPNKHIPGALGFNLPGATDPQVYGSPLPTLSPPERPAAQPGSRERPFETPEDVVEDALSTIEGFELVEHRTGLKILFPRPW
ncbi:MAG TPA: hypothetical protein VGF59_23790 [Bryobacteraceae bacterium]|jgi:hypothetical protein